MIRLQHVLLVLLLPLVAAFYDGYELVEDLDPKTLQNVHDSDALWIVEFYAPW